MFSSLPIELWIEIFVYLDPESILTLRTINKELYKFFECKSKDEFDRLSIILIKTPPIHTDLLNIIQLSSKGYDKMSYLNKFIFTFKIKKQLLNMYNYYSYDEELLLQFFLKKAEYFCYWQNDWANYCYATFRKMPIEKKHLLHLEIKLSQIYNTQNLSKSCIYGTLGTYWFPKSVIPNWRKHISKNALNWY